MDTSRPNRGGTRPDGSATLFPRGRLFAAAAFLPLSLAWALPLAAQGEVAGRVVDASTLAPMAGVQVFVPGTETGTLTDRQGAFRLGGLTGARVTLRFQYLGYRPVERAVDVGATDIEMQLSPQAIPLDEIVVTGTAGERRARAIGNAVGRLDAGRITEVAPPPDVQGLIGARVSGVRIRDATGEVGTGGSTTIRGVGSLALSSEPLIYVDGVRINNEPTADGAAFSGNFGDAGPSRINEINPEDIESIEIIKGPAASTLYGTEASNGVIQIITKKGSRDRSEFRVQIRQGANYLPNPEEVFPTVWATNADGEVVGLNILENDEAQGFGSPFRTGHNQEYVASLSGGAEEIQYYLSGAFRRNEGMVPYNWENQVNARTNFTFSPSPIVEANLNIGFVTSRTSAASAAQPLPTHIIWGTPLLKDTPNRGYLVSTPEKFEEDVEGKEDVDRTTISLNVTHDPFPWLSHRLTLGTDLSNVRSTLLCRRDLAGGQPCGVPVGLREVDRERASFLSVDYGVTGRLDLGPDLRANTSFGATFHRRMFETEELEGQDLAIEQLETVSATAGDQRSAEEEFLENRTLGLFVQEQLVWKNRLFLTAALRGDDNSAFGRDFDFVTYPKFSASWVVSEEPFFDVGFLNTLRLRAAWGRAGQQPDAFAAIRTYSPISGPGGQPGLTPENVGNPELEPEVGEEIELGFDASLWNDRISLDFTYYDQNTESAIVARPALPSLGFPGEQFVNIGRVGNSGFEAALGAEILRRDDVGVRFDVALSRNTNRVEELGDVESIVHEANVGQRHVEGFPLGGIYLPNIVNAEFDSEGNLVNVMCEGGDPLTGGGPPVPCSEAGTAFIGQPIPVWVGSAASAVTLFGNLELYALAEWESGHTRLSGDIAAAHIFFRNSRCIHTRCDPFLAAAEQLIGGGAPFVTAGIMDAGWLKLRTLSATYRIPPSVAGLIGASRASLTLSGRNVATLWVAEREKFGHRLPDPETAEAQPLNAYIQESWPHTTTVEAVLRLAF